MSSSHTPKTSPNNPNSSNNDAITKLRHQHSASSPVNRYVTQSLSPFQGFESRRKKFVKAESEMCLVKERSGSGQKSRKLPPVFKTLSIATESPSPHSESPTASTLRPSSLSPSKMQKLTGEREREREKGRSISRASLQQRSASPSIIQKLRGEKSGARGASTGNIHSSTPTSHPETSAVLLRRIAASLDSPQHDNWPSTSCTLSSSSSLHKGAGNNNASSNSPSSSALKALKTSKPKLLTDLENYISHELHHLTSGTTSGSGDPNAAIISDSGGERVKIFGNCLDFLGAVFRNYGPLLVRIRGEYDAYVREIVGKCEEIPFLRARVETAEIVKSSALNEARTQYDRDLGERERRLRDLQMMLEVAEFRNVHLEQENARLKQDVEMLQNMRRRLDNHGFQSPNATFDPRSAFQPPNAQSLSLSPSTTTGGGAANPSLSLSLSLSAYGEKSYMQERLEVLEDESKCYKQLYKSAQERLEDAQRTLKNVETKHAAGMYVEKSLYDDSQKNNNRLQAKFQQLTDLLRNAYEQRDRAQNDVKKLRLRLQRIYNQFGLIGSVSETGSVINSTPSGTPTLARAPLPAIGGAGNNSPASDVPEGRVGNNNESSQSSLTPMPGGNYSTGLGTGGANAPLPSINSSVNGSNNNPADGSTLPRPPVNLIHAPSLPSMLRHFQSWANLPCNISDPSGVVGTPAGVENSSPSMIVESVDGGISAPMSTGMPMDYCTEWPLRVLFRHFIGRGPSINLDTLADSTDIIARDMLAPSYPGLCYKGKRPSPPISRLMSEQLIRNFWRWRLAAESLGSGSEAVKLMLGGERERDSVVVLGFRECESGIGLESAWREYCRMLIGACLEPSDLTYSPCNNSTSPKDHRVQLIQYLTDCLSSSLCISLRQWKRVSHLSKLLHQVYLGNLRVGAVEDLFHVVDKLGERLWEISVVEGESGERKVEWKAFCKVLEGFFTTCDAENLRLLEEKLSPYVCGESGERYVRLAEILDDSPSRRSMRMYIRSVLGGDGEIGDESISLPGENSGTKSYFTDEVIHQYFSDLVSYITTLQAEIMSTADTETGTCTPASVAEAMYAVDSTAEAVNIDALVVPLFSTTLADLNPTLVEGNRRTYNVDIRIDCAEILEKLTANNIVKSVLVS